MFFWSGDVLLVGQRCGQTPVDIARPLPGLPARRTRCGACVELAGSTSPRLVENARSDSHALASPQPVRRAACSNPTVASSTALPCQLFGFAALKPFRQGPLFDLTALRPFQNGQLFNLTALRLF
jgi:hypothetical protein